MENSPQKIKELEKQVAVLEKENSRLLEAFETGNRELVSTNPSTTTQEVPPDSIQRNNRLSIEKIELERQQFHYRTLFIRY